MSAEALYPENQPYNARLLVVREGAALDGLRLKTMLNSQNLTA
jgi:hypothetical protein